MTVNERILALLADYDPVPLTTDDLADVLNLSRKHVQNQLKELNQAHLIIRSGTRGPGAVTHVRLTEAVA